MPMVGLGQRAARFEGLKAVTLTNYVIPPRALARIFFFQAEDCIRVRTVTGVQTCALPISPVRGGRARDQERQEEEDPDPEQQRQSEHQGDRRLAELDALVAFLAGAGGLDRGAPDEPEIGRASCRERVLIMPTVSS